MKRLSLNNYDYTKLLDDLKLISRSVKIVIEEKNLEKRRFAGLLTDDLITRIFRDIQEMHKTTENNKNEFAGTLDNKQEK